MTATVIFNTDRKLKNAAMKKARSQGMNLSVLLNTAMRSYVENRLEIDALAASIARGREDVLAGRVISQETLFKKLGL